MKKIAILLTSLLIAFITSCQDHVFEPDPNNPQLTETAWYSGGPISSIRSFAVDKNGNSYVTGTYMGTATFGNISMTGSGQVNKPYIVKYNRAGEVQWVQNVEGESTGGIYAIDVDGDGNIYATGGLNGSATFGGITLTGIGIFIVKFNTNGQVQWAQKIDALQSLFPLGPGVLGITVDEHHNIYLAGTFEGTVAFGGTTLYSTPSGLKIPEDVDAYLAKLNTDGVFQWAKKLGGARIEIGYDVAVDKAGNIYTSGFSSSNPARFEEIEIDLSGGRSYAAKYNPDGTVNWVTNYHSGPIEFNSKIVVDGSGNSFTYTRDILTRLNNNGEIQWSKQLGTATISDIAATTNGELIVSGTFTGTLTTDGYTLTASGGKDIFLAKLNPNGDIVWIRKDGGSHDESGLSLDLGSDGYIYVTGTFTNSTTIAGKELTAGEGSHIFIARYKQ